ncbi:MAG: hypothetical protein WD069_13485 [Planctomycetales bacterium]
MTTRKTSLGRWSQAVLATAVMSLLLDHAAVQAAGRRGSGPTMFGGASKFQGSFSPPTGMQSQSFARPTQFAQPQQPMIQSSKFMPQQGLGSSRTNFPSLKPQVITTPTQRGGFQPNMTLPGKPATPGRIVDTFPKNTGQFKPELIKPGTIKPGTIKPDFKTPIVNNPIRTTPGFPKPNLTKPSLTNPILTKPGKIVDLSPKGDKPRFDVPVKPISIDPARLKPGMKIPDLQKVADVRPRPNLADKLKGGNLANVLGSANGRKMDLGQQFDLKKQGDVARRLDLFGGLQKQGGWHDRAFCGPVTKDFQHNHFGCWYPGPQCYPSYCWAPCWNPWVQWCWWDYCYPVCDPRPIYCRPICYDPCGPWVHWHYPIWRPLPIVVCGTWVDVPVVHVPVGLDLQLLAVRFVDPGHPEQKLGPRYRVWFRNNSAVDMLHQFDVMLLASNDDVPSATLPQAGVRVDSMPAGAIQAVDIRLPFEANVMNRDAAGHAVPFDKLHVLIDARREIVEAFEENNGQIMARVDVFPVDPALFAADVDAAPAGSAINLAGEGLGPEPGRVLVFVGGLELEAVTEGWYDLGVRIALPGLQLAAPAAAEIVVVRGDGAATDPLSFTLMPTAAAVVAAPLPTP